MRSVLGRAITVGLLAVGLVCRPGEAQDRATDFAEKPILVLDNGGHHAPVRRLVFTPDESRLLSAGDDKVVRVWDLKASPAALGWTIRPPIWRGQAGAINAMALTTPDARGNQTLALAGYGVQSMRGEIGLYRFPGAVDRRQGDVEGVIAGGDMVPLLSDTKGHVNPVTCMAFDPRGGVLASSSIDTTVRLWDYRNRTQAGFMPHPGRVNALAFSPDGRRLATGGLDGVLRVWDVAARPPVLVGQATAPIIIANDPGGLAINALDVSPDGRWVVTGREDGVLFRYNLANPAEAPIRSPVSDRQGAVEALAFGPDGRLATSIIGRRIANPGDRPTVACDIEIRRAVDLAVTEVLPPSTNLVYALAFSPRGSYLAFAGGDKQDVRLKDLRDPARPIVNLSEPVTQGMSIWDVGFVGDTSVAYSYTQPTAPPTPVYWGFDLRERSRTSFNRDQVRRAIPTYEGWTVRPVGAYSLEVLRGGAVAFRVELSPDLDGRWWDYSFLPPGPKHDRPSIALACQRGVAVYRLVDGARTRFLDGHNGAVYCLAPSPDGKWLATGSSDQTVRLWPLAGSDVVAPLGAEFEPRGAALAVKSVEPNGFADIAGLRVGDLLDEVALGGKVIAAEVFLETFAAAPPNTNLQFKGRRARAGGAADEAVLAGTTKRDRPGLSLFVGLDREWVLWMPRGFYDASVIGDATFLGWQVNRSTIARPSPTDFYPILMHEKALRQPKGVPNNAIDRLLTAADEVVAFGPARVDQEATVQADRPSRVTPIVGAGGAVVRGADGAPIAPGSPLPDAFSMGPGTLAVEWRVETWKARAPGPFGVWVSGETVRPPLAPPFDPAVGVASVPMRYDLPEPGTYVFRALADSGLGNQRELTITARVEGPPPKKPGRLKILAIAPTFDDPKIRPIAASMRDVEDLLPFFDRHVVSESGGRLDAVETRLVGKDASASKVAEALDAMASQGTVQRGDLAIVLIETYVLARGTESVLVVSDTESSPTKLATTVPAESVAAALESMVRRGCKVIVVLDGVHKSPEGAKGSDVVEWARRLRNDHDVITVLATTRGPILDENVGVHRPLARSILDSIRSANRRPTDPLMSLADVRQAVVDGVQRLTRQRGEPAIYIPRGIDAGSPILDRKP